MEKNQFCRELSESPKFFCLLVSLISETTTNYTVLSLYMNQELFILNLSHGTPAARSNWPVTRGSPTRNWPVTRGSPTRNWPVNRGSPTRNWPVTRGSPTRNWPVTRGSPTRNWPVTRGSPTRLVRTVAVSSAVQRYLFTLLYLLTSLLTYLLTQLLTVLTYSAAPRGALSLCVHM